MTILALENLVKAYHKRRVVNGVSMRVARGQVVGLLGPNGAGKTTTFYMTVGIVHADEGRVLLNGVDLTESPMHVRARKGIGYLPQESSIFRRLSVAQNVAAILEIHLSSRDEINARAESLLEELGIRHLAGQKALLLSGGERRRLEIARALATNPFFMLLDEPFAGIDPLAVVDIQRIIGHLSERGIGVLISDHNVRETLGVCDTAYILNEGTVIESGTPEEITGSEVARQFYLGQEFRL
ncbi:LPS export ABC transporter ATP-binding protein [Thermodesulfobacteriota bacterium]